MGGLILVALLLALSLRRRQLRRRSPGPRSDNLMLGTPKEVGLNYHTLPAALCDVANAPAA